MSVTIECLKNVIISDSSCCSLYDHEAFTGIKLTIGQKKYYFRPYSILLYKKGQITIRDIENSVTFSETQGNLTFAQIRNVIANCAACGCDAVPVLLTSPNNTIAINTLGSGVTEIEADLGNLASSDANNQLVQGSDTLWYVPPTLWSTIQGAQNVVNVSGFTNDAGYLTSVGWGDITGAQNVIPLSGFNNDIGFITGVTWAQITGLQNVINLSLFNNDANFVAVGAPISSFTNDLNFISLGDDITLLNNNAGYVNAAQAAAAAPVQSVNTQTGNVVLGVNDLNDATITAPVIGQALVWNGTQWVNGSGVPTTTNGQILKNLGAGLVAVSHAKAWFASQTRSDIYEVFDSFDRFDGPVGNAESGQAWTGPTEYRIKKGHLNSSFSADNPLPLIVNTGFAQKYFEFEYLISGSVDLFNRRFGICFSYIDSNNYSLIRVAVGRIIILRKVVAGVTTDVISINLGLPDFIQSGKLYFHLTNTNIQWSGFLKDNTVRNFSLSDTDIQAQRTAGGFNNFGFGLPSGLYIKNLKIKNPTVDI